MGGILKEEQIIVCVTAADRKSQDMVKLATLKPVGVYFWKQQTMDFLATMITCSNGLPVVIMNNP